MKLLRLIDWMALRQYANSKVPTQLSKVVPIIKSIKNGCIGYSVNVDRKEVAV